MNERDEAMVKALGEMKEALGEMKEEIAALRRDLATLIAAVREIKNFIVVPADPADPKIVDPKILLDYLENHSPRKLVNFLDSRDSSEDLKKVICVDSGALPSGKLPPRHPWLSRFQIFFQSVMPYRKRS